MCIIHLLKMVTELESTYPPTVEISGKLSPRNDGPSFNNNSRDALRLVTCTVESFVVTGFQIMYLFICSGVYSSSSSGAWYCLGWTENLSCGRLTHFWMCVFGGEAKLFDFYVDRFLTCCENILCHHLLS